MQPLSRQWKRATPANVLSKRRGQDSTGHVVKASISVAEPEIVDGDTVVVVGASGGIGRLVVQR